jgi:hypothetical protein
MRKCSLLSSVFDETIFPISLHSYLPPSISPNQGNKDENYGSKFYIHPKPGAAFTALFVTILASTQYTFVDISFTNFLIEKLTLMAEYT